MSEKPSVANQQGSQLLIALMMAWKNNRWDLIGDFEGKKELIKELEEEEPPS